MFLVTGVLWLLAWPACGLLLQDLIGSLLFFSFTMNVNYTIISSFLICDPRLDVSKIHLLVFTIRLWWKFGADGWVGRWDKEQKARIIWFISCLVSLLVKWRFIWEISYQNLLLFLLQHRSSIFLFSPKFSVLGFHILLCSITFLFTKWKTLIWLILCISVGQLDYRLVRANFGSVYFVHNFSSNLRFQC